MTAPLQARGRQGRVSKACKLRAQAATKVEQSDAYNDKMKKAMGWQDADPYQYYYDRGLYYHEIIPDLLCGSQPRNVEDIIELKEEVGATTVINVGVLSKHSLHSTLYSAQMSCHTTVTRCACY